MPQAVRKWDTVVIGGGIAGSGTAQLLARGGRSVLLLEKEPGAHHKVCGEFISPPALRHLHDLGVDPAGRGAAPIRHIRLTHGRRTAFAPLPFTALSLSRQVLDEALLSRACEAGAVIRRGMPANAMARDGAGWRVSLAGQDSVFADTIFLATGKHDLRGWPRTANRPSDLIGFKMHYRLAPEQQAALNSHIELFLFEGGYAGLEPVEEGRANLCLVVGKARFAACGKSWDGLLEKLMRETPALAGRLDKAHPGRERPFAVYGIPYGYISERTEPSLYRLGDQAAVIPSFCGEGMAIALHTACLAAGHYLDGHDAASYARHMRRAVRPRIRMAGRIARLAGQPRAQGLAVAACRLAPGLLPAMARLTRL